MTQENITKVHLIFKTHLDVGFTNYARNVLQNYFDVFIPQAIQTASAFRQERRAERFVWTTGSYLIYEYLETASAEKRTSLERAIQAGDIVWHGLPVTTHTELMDAPLFKFGLSLSQQLDKRFGKKTIAAKMTDVPGHSRAIVPLLAEAGITFLHIGVNPASTPPEVPPVFVWRDEASGTDVMVMYHRGSYGDVMIVPGLSEAICFAHTDDNRGPQTPDQALESFRHMRERFPKAEIVGSTLDAFAQALQKVKPALPVITQEFGDTWIHGVGSDPAKTNPYRELLRLRQNWISGGKIQANDPALVAFSRRLLLVPEHSWGMDMKTFCPDATHYSADSFSAARQKPDFQIVESSWVEKRAYIQEAITALGSSRLADEAKAHLAAITPKRPDETRFQRIKFLSDSFETAHFSVGFDAERGSINRLTDKLTGRAWAAHDHELALFSYQTFSQEDYDRFYRQYIINKKETRPWSIPDFTKPGLAESDSEHRIEFARLLEAYRQKDEQGHRFILKLGVSEAVSTRYGCPSTLITELFLPDAEPVMHVDFQWFDKRACRMPEAIWLAFNPVTGDSNGWKLHKLGSLISPLDVIRDGNRHLHAVNPGVSYRDLRGGLSIDSLDASLVAPGAPSLLDFNNRQPSLRKGMHFNLFNNVWGTNFVMWFDGDARFRFVLKFDRGA